MDQATVLAPREMWIVVLAAGASSRLGTPKQLLRTRGRTLLARTVSVATSVAGTRVCVVIGAGQQRLRSHLRKAAPHVRVVYNGHWLHGMGSSLAAGIRALPEQAGAALVLLCDQPGIDAHCLGRLLRPARARPSAIVASRYAGRHGVPAVLPKAAFRSLRALQEDRGARELLNAPDGRFRILAVDMPEAALDIDTPQDAASLRA